MKTFLMFSFVVVCSLSTLANEAAPSSTDSPQHEAFVALIDRLGDDSYSSREGAAEELVKHGLSARPALEGALEHPDLEVRMRADKLLVMIARADLDRRLTDFINDVDGKNDHALPGWKRYQEIMGNERDSRKLFADMVRSESALLKAYELGATKVNNAYALRIQSFVQSGVSSSQREPVKTQSLATLLFVGADENIKLDTSLGYQIYNLLNQTSAQTALTSDSRSPLTRKLLTVFLQRQNSNTILARNGLFLTMRFNMNDVGLSLAVDLMKQKNISTSTIPYAVLTIAKFGNEEHIESLKGMLENKTVCHSWHNGKFKDPIRVQVRDVALVALLHLTKQEPTDYGFDLLRKSTMMLYEVYTCGFVEDTKREAAFAKWEKWLASK